MDVLGVSALYHDAAAALVRDGEIVAAAQQERFSRRKHDPSFPVDAIAFCLEEAGGPDAPELDAFVYYDKPLTTFIRVLRTYASVGPRGVRTFPTAMGEWGRRKLWVSYQIERTLRSLGRRRPTRVLFAEHHVSHAAAAFYPSPFDEAAILTIDGVGEWATSTIGRGRGRQVELRRELRFPDSLGLLYSAFTYQCGFKVNSGEYKLMGLAPFGEPRFVDQILDDVVDLAADGSLRLNLRYFDYLAGQRMTNARFASRFEGPPRRPDEPITQRECDLARSIQEVVEETVLRMARTAWEDTGLKNLVLAGGVALNCVANGRLEREGPFEALWVQPAAGDAGSALGAALWGYHQILEQPRTADPDDRMRGSSLGPSYAAETVAAKLSEAGRPFERLPEAGARARRIAELVDRGEVVALFNGPMEFGPRALGNRSILADARDPAMQRTLNEKVKKREGFRPFAPAVLAEQAAAWFDLDAPSPYMTLVAEVHPDQRVEGGPDLGQSGDVLDLAERLARPRSSIPAVTHVDGSARIQTVTSGRAPELHRILTAFAERTDCPVIINTSFNVRGEPIVCTPEDAYRCFMTTDIDWLVIEDCLLSRADQPAWTGPTPEPDED